LLPLLLLLLLLLLLRTGAVVSGLSQRSTCTVCADADSLIVLLPLLLLLLLLPLLLQRTGCRRRP
jgi:hypothetical protein